MIVECPAVPRGWPWDCAGIYLVAHERVAGKVQAQKGVERNVLGLGVDESAGLLCLDFAFVVSLFLFWILTLVICNGFLLRT